MRFETYIRHVCTRRKYVRGKGELVRISHWCIMLIADCRTTRARRQFTVISYWE